MGQSIFLASVRHRRSAAYAIASKYVSRSSSSRQVQPSGGRLGGAPSCSHATSASLSRAELVFDAEPMAELVALVEGKIDELRGAGVA